MITGEETLEVPGSICQSCTVEMLNDHEYFDIVVVDECQMIADPYRGHNWTRAVLGLRADEIHLCMAPEAEDIVVQMIKRCGDQYRVVRHKRNTRLTMESKPYNLKRDLKKGDALIVFSKKSVLDVAGRLEETGINASVIYGSLPPEIRRRQMHLFHKGKTKVVVATDAIGMGLNLPVRRIIFLQAEKFDGVSRRKLTTAEVRQIAGRAGRFGLYDKGYVTAMGEEELSYIRDHYAAPEESLTEVNLGFPQMLLDIDAPLDEILKIWHSVTPTDPFVKENIDEALFLYEQAKQNRKMIDGFDDKYVLYKMITCPIDIKDKKVVDLWNHYCCTYTADVSLERPVLYREKKGGIQQYETYYKQLDLYYQFSHRMQKVIEEDWLRREREKTEMRIMSYLTKGKQSYIARCRYCGKLLPLGSTFPVCDDCFRQEVRAKYGRKDKNGGTTDGKVGGDKKRRGLSGHRRKVRHQSVHGTADSK